MGMKDRIKKIRLDNKLSQTDFAEALLVSRSAVCKMESGENEPSKQTKELICSTFNVNKEWLESNVGEPYLSLSKNQLITDFVADLLKEEDNSYRKRLVEVLANLDVDDWAVLEKISNSLIKKENLE